MSGGTTTSGSGDAMLDIMMREETIKLVSTLIAKLERVTYENTRTSIFRTKWGKDIFVECMTRFTKLTGTSSVGFDIDVWFRTIVDQSKAMSKSIRRDIPGHLYNQAIEINWVTHLLSLEMDFAGKMAMSGLKNDGMGIMRILYTILELEDEAQNKLASYCKQETQYDLVGANMATKNPDNIKLLTASSSAGANAPQPGSADDMLKNKNFKF